MCWSLPYLEGILVDIVIITAVVLIIRLIVPYLLNLAGINTGGVVMQAINIIVGAIVLIFVIYLVFGLLGCVGTFHNY